MVLEKAGDYGRERTPQRCDSIKSRQKCPGSIAPETPMLPGGDISVGEKRLTFGQTLLY